MPFTGTVMDTARRHPDRVAIAERDRRVTYGELVDMSPIVFAGVRAALRRQHSSAEGVDAPVDLRGLPLIAICVESALDVATLTAVLAGYGVVTTVMDPRWPAEHRIRAVRSGGARLVVTEDATFAEELTEAGWTGTVLTPAELLDEGRGALSAGDVPIPPQVRDATEPFCLIFTSGTTDLPKGFLRTRQSWRVNMRVSEEYLYASPGVKTIAPGPLAYSLTLYALVETLGTAGSMWLQSRFDPIGVAQTIDETSVKRLVAVPAVLPALAAAARRRDSTLPSLRHVVVGGANLSAAVRQAFEEAVPSASVLCYYGAGEIGFIGVSRSGEGNVLEPIRGVELSVRNDAGEEVSPGELGQLFVRVASQGDRYITAGGDPITGPDGWSTVNDMARFRDGTLTLEGRAGDIAVTGGHKVSLLQIERVLHGFPGCESATVVTQPDAVLGERLVAVVEAPAPDKSMLLEHLSAHLAPQFVPHRFVEAANLPRTVGGKIRRGQVREELAAGRYRRL